MMNLRIIISILIVKFGVGQMNKFKTNLLESDIIIFVIVYVPIVILSQFLIIFNIPESYKLDVIIFTMLGLPVLVIPVALLIYLLIILIFTWRGGEFK